MQIGQCNRLVVKQLSTGGAIFDGGQFGDVFMPNSHMKQPLVVGEQHSVFVFLDNKGQLIATFKSAKAAVDQFAYLQVVSLTSAGAFLDWGLPKDLFAPFIEQKVPMVVGEFYPIFVYVEPRQNRLVASSKIDKFIEYELLDLKVNQGVDLLIESKTPLGFKAIINNAHFGMLFYDQASEFIEVGQRLRGYIKTIRDDKKIDLSLQPIGAQKFDLNRQKILMHIERNQGFLALHDKSSPQAINKALGMSKKLFKMSIGRLKSEGIIRISDEGIYLIEKGST